MFFFCESKALKGIEALYGNVVDVLRIESEDGILIVNGLEDRV